MAPDEIKLRMLLAVQYAGHLLYRDDGELQDNRAYPFIDFLRDTPQQIEEKMIARGLREIQQHMLAVNDQLQTLSGTVEATNQKLP